MKKAPKTCLTRTLALLSLLLLVCASCLTAIGCNVKGPNTKPSDNTTAVQDQTTSGEPEVVYPEYDKDFRIMHRSDRPYEFKVKDTVGADPVNDAVYSRNQLIEKRYKITIKNLTYDGNWDNRNSPGAFKDTLKVWMDANEDAVDLIAGYHRVMLPTVENDWYVDWLTVPNIDLRAEEWQNGINDVLTINNKNYTITGDITLTFWKAMSAMVFHDGLLRDYCDENIYDVVSSGKWTMEYMMNIAQKVPSTGEGTNRIYGFASNNSIALDAFASGFGMQTVTKDENGNFRFALETDRNTMLLDKLVELYQAEYTYREQYNTQLDHANDPSHALFPNRQVLFNAMQFEMIERPNIRNMTENYGVLPYPKFDSDQENYHTLVADGVSLMFVPKTEKDLEMVGTVTAALAEASRELVNPKYIEVVLQGSVSRDEQSAAMIDLIRNNVFVDPGYILNATAGLALRDLTMKNAFKFDGPKTLKVYWEEKGAGAENALSEFLAFYNK